MKDTSLGIAAIMAHGEAQLRANRAESERTTQKIIHERRMDEFQKTNDNLARINTGLEDELAYHVREKFQAHNNFAQEREIRNKVTNDYNNLYNQHEALKAENEYYKSLLCKPMLEIAQANGDFKKTYEEQMAFVADWMVSQKAFQELAIELGEKQGMSVEEIITKAETKTDGVLNKEHEESHGTNADPFISYYFKKKKK